MPAIYGAERQRNRCHRDYRRRHDRYRTAGYGIFARNYGSGALTVTANGDVSGDDGVGILARNVNGTESQRDHRPATTGHRRLRAASMPATTAAGR